MPRKRLKRTENVEQFILDNYRNHSLNAMSEMVGVNPATLYYYVCKLGLKDCLKREYVVGRRGRKKAKKREKFFNVNKYSNWLF